MFQKFNPEPIFRRAMMAVEPDYLSWSADQQENYRLRLERGEEKHFKFEQLVIKQLFGITATDAEHLQNVFDGFNDEDYWRFNSVLLHLHGLGEDRFFLNESLGEDRTLADFATLWDYDHEDFLFQQADRQQHNTPRANWPYLGELDGRWARLEYQGGMIYASLWMAWSYVAMGLEDAGRLKIEQMIPHEFVPGPQHMKPVKGGFQWDMHADAGGQEAVLRELERRFFTYLQERRHALAEHFAQTNQPQVCWIENTDSPDPHWNIVFSDPSALKAVRLRHFVRDCAAMPCDLSRLETIEQAEIQAAAEFLEAQHLAICAAHDPTVVPLRRRRTIVVSPDVLDRLE